MNAQHVLNVLLEDELDFDLEPEVERYTDTMRFDRGAASTLRAAR